MQIEVDRNEAIKYAYQCDLCGKVSAYRRICSICNRDICSDCTLFDPRCNIDYPEKYCTSCFKIGEKYIERMNEEQEKFDIIMEEIEQEWRDEAIKVANLTKTKQNI